MIRSKKVAGQVAFDIILWVLLYANLPWIASVFSELLLQDILEMELGHFRSALEFFIFEVPKVLLLLGGVVFVVGVLRTYLNPVKIRLWLSKRSRVSAHCFAALFGSMTPFCSCSAVPLFIGFVQAGVPLGVTFSFLIAAPMVNEVAVALLLSAFGVKVAALYFVAGIFIAVFAGIIIGILKLESEVESWINDGVADAVEATEVPLFADRIEQGRAAVQEILSKVWLSIIIGVGIGASIHGYVPQDFFSSLLGAETWWSVPLAVLLGVPMYSNAAGIFPIAQALLGKGAALGTTLAFMMSVIALFLPEVIILRRVLKIKLIGAFLGVVTVGIIIVGYLFNLLRR